MAIVEVVKYDGAPEVFAWKYPNAELGTWTQLIVNESQEAVLFKDGKAYDVFSGGKYTLDTNNFPLLTHIINLPFGGRSPFAAEVWYVNKLYNLDIKWGTASPIQIQDPKYGIFVPIRSNGAFGIQVEDSRKFLIKLVGTASGFDAKSIISYFRGLYITKVKDVLSSYVVKKSISVLEINAYIDELSAYMKQRIEPEMLEYGVRLISFYVNDISIPEDDPAVITLKDALAKKAEMNIIGYNYQQERSFDTMESAAQNRGMGIAPFMGAGMGLGMGAGIGNVMARAMSDMAGNITVNSTSGSGVLCPKCHNALFPGQRFCGSCGFDTQKEDNRKDKGMVCSQCGASLREGIKFCPDCGKPVRKICPGCGVSVHGDPVFCSECGRKLR